MERADGVAPAASAAEFYAHGSVVVGRVRQPIAVERNVRRGSECPPFETAASTKTKNAHVFAKHAEWSADREASSAFTNMRIS